MNPVRELRRTAGLTQRGLADTATTSQPTIAAYESFKKHPTTLTLERLARSVGLDVSYEFVPRLTREDRRSLHLHRAIAHRITDEPVAILKKARRNLSVMAAANPDASPLLCVWETILTLPVGVILRIVTDPGQYARDLRQVTPFAGILAAHERAAAYKSFKVLEALAV